MLQTSSRASSSAGSIGRPVLALRSYAPATMCGDERGEQAAEAALVVGGRDEVEGVGAVEQPVGADPRFAHGRAGDLRFLPGVERGRDRLQQA